MSKFCKYATNEVLQGMCWLDFNFNQKSIISFVKNHQLNNKKLVRNGKKGTQHVNLQGCLHLLKTNFGSRIII
jgi:hypothetical protein